MTNYPITQITWQSHLHAVWAIAWKNWLHFIRYPLNAIFRVLQPLMWLTPIYFLGQSFRTAEGNVGFAAYAGTGDYMSFILVGSILSSYISSVWAFWRWAGGSLALPSPAVCGRRSWWCCLCCWRSMALVLPLRRLCF